MSAPTAAWTALAAPAREVLAFWLSDSLDSLEALRERNRLWFDGDAQVDAVIRERFSATVEAAGRGEFDAWVESAWGRLALLILLDQFPRNLYRGTARAFAFDGRAQALAVEGLARGHDRALPPAARLFCYMPLEHAEDLALQVRCVAQVAALHAEAPAALAPIFAEYVVYAQRHRDVIARFGRFPHRNAALGRDSTPEERAYLVQPGAGF